MTHDEILTYDFLVENYYFTVEELNLVRKLVDGTWTEIMNKAIYARYGYNDFDQMFSAEDEEE